MINLYVDDLRDCPKGFIVARNMEKAIDYIENNEVNILSLDHNLGADQEGNILPTGYRSIRPYYIFLCLL